MKKFLTMFLLFILLGGLANAQTTISIMKGEPFSNNKLQVTPDIQRNDGREMYKWFNKTEGDLPYDDILAGAKLSIIIQHIIPWEDDTTLTNMYAHSWELYICDQYGNRLPATMGYVQYGDSNYVEVDVTAFAPILMQEKSAIYYWMGTWAQAPVFVDMDFVITPDPAVTAPYWMEKIVATAGVYSEKDEERWENSEFMVPAGLQNKAIRYLGMGGNVYGWTPIDVEFMIDGTTVYTFDPYIEDCSQYWPFNNALDDSLEAKYSGGRTGACVGGLVEPVVLAGDYMNSLTDGEHNLRFQHLLFEPEEWSDFRCSALMYAEKDESAAPASVIEIVAPTTNFGATERIMPINLYFNNDAGIGVATCEALLNISGDGMLFQTLGDTAWASTLQINHTGASAMINAKAITAGTSTIVIEDGNGNLPTATLSMEVEENLTKNITSTWANGVCNPETEAAPHAVDGKLTTKWCNNQNGDTYPKNAIYGFATPQEFNYVILYHAEAGGEGASMNTSDFQIRYHDPSDATWKVFNDITDNEAGITYHWLDDSFTSVTADSIEISVTLAEASGGNVVRLYELEIFNTTTPYLSTTDDDFKPAKFEVFQNYPNPFNPATEIKFFNPSRGQVDIRIYNALGQEISNLLRGELNAGTHTVRWNGTNSNGHKIAGGIYFYNVRFTDNAGNKQVISRKMVLLP